MWSIFRALKRSWAQHFISQVSAFMILVLTYSAVVFIALSLTNVQQLFSLWGQVSQVTIYLKKGAEESSKQDLGKFLKSNPIVSQAELISSGQAAEKFRKRFQGLSSQKIDPSKMREFFPEFFEVNLVQARAYGSDSSELEDFAGALRDNFNSVASVSYGKSWLKQYISILRGVETVAWLLIGAFLLGSLVVSSNVIKTILFHRRDEVEVLEFIGADDRVIYLPQILNVAITGLVALTAAVAVNYSIYTYVLTSKSLALSLSVRDQLTFLSPGFLIALYGVSLVALLADSVRTIYRMMPRNTISAKRGCFL